MPRALVAYATKYGSTREVAEAVARTLGERGYETEVASAHDVRDPGERDLVVLGGPLYYYHWHRDARRFLSRHRARLAGTQVAVFALGPLSDNPDERVSARTQLDKALERYGWLTPVAVAVFGGKFDPDHLRFPDRNPAMNAVPAGDLRDFDAVAAWAGQVADALERV